LVLFVKAKAVGARVLEKPWRDLAKVRTQVISECSAKPPKVAQRAAASKGSTKLNPLDEFGSNLNPVGWLRQATVVGTPHEIDRLIQIWSGAQQNNHRAGSRAWRRQNRHRRRPGSADHGREIPTILEDQRVFILDIRPAWWPAAIAVNLRNAPQERIMEEIRAAAPAM